MKIKSITPGIVNTRAHTAVRVGILTVYRDGRIWEGVEYETSDSCIVVIERTVLADGAKHLGFRHRDIKPMWWSSSHADATRRWMSDNIPRLLQSMSASYYGGSLDVSAGVTKEAAAARDRAIPIIGGSK